ncbi:MAG: DUF4314 domain-containing protein [Oscillospiraceae bacterium]|nr:DUF4314 domain-containing protein [Oscillospiraceae bacterium]MDO5150480.1 DUF4314 domain-containing protein [Oscillospiraceae bacterium]
MNYKEKADEIRKKYPAGTVICIEHMEDERPVNAGTKGTVKRVDDIGTIHCVFEDGRVLGVVPGIDKFYILRGE